MSCYSLILGIFTFDNIIFQLFKFLVTIFPVLLHYSLLWMVALLTMLTWMIFNISLRLEAYLDSPIRVNIDVKQHTRLKFPAITICNKNFARLVWHFQLIVYRMEFEKTRWFWPRNSDQINTQQSAGVWWGRRGSVVVCQGVVGVGGSGYGEVVGLASLGDGKGRSLGGVRVVV